MMIQLFALLLCSALTSASDGSCLPCSLLKKLWSAHTEDELLPLDSPLPPLSPHAIYGHFAPPSPPRSKGKRLSLSVNIPILAPITEQEGSYGIWNGIMNRDFSGHSPLFGAERKSIMGFMAQRDQMLATPMSPDQNEGGSGGEAFVPESPEFESTPWEHIPSSP